ncbi:MAG: DUF5085 family protein [Bifidobacterium sp.]|jgi:hypothetical protein
MKIAFPDIVWREKISYQNVVSVRTGFHYTDMQHEYAMFVDQIAQAGYTLKGPFFYSLNNTPLDEMVDIEQFLPVYEHQPARTSETSGLRFQSYFEIGPVFRGTVVKDFERQTERVYAELLETLATNHLEMNTPFFHVAPQDGAPYMHVYLGYTHQSDSPSSTPLIF